MRHHPLNIYAGPVVLSTLLLASSAFVSGPASGSTRWADPAIFFPQTFLNPSPPSSDHLFPSLRQPAGPSWQSIASTTRTRKLVLLQAKKDTEKDAESDVDSSTSPNNSGNDLAWFFTLCLPLWLVYISNQWSRSSIYYLVNFGAASSDAVTAMNVDLGFNQAQYGVLASVAFTSLFAIASLGAGFAADRFNRKTLTVLSAASWSVAVVGTALAQSYAVVVACRIAMGLACAFSTPTAYTLIRDNVPPGKVATASSFYGTGVALGSGLASLTILLDNAVGWRGALDAIAITGFASVALSLVLLPNDADDADEKDESSQSATRTPTTTMDKTSNDQEEGFASILSDVQEAFASDRAQWIYLASLLRFCSGLCIGVWSAPYFRMVFDSRSSDYAVAQAAISAIGATASGVLGGTIADQLSSSAASQGDNKNDGGTDAIGRRLWVPVVGSVLAAPTWYLAVHSPDSFELSMAWLAAEYFVAECWFGPTISTLQSSVPSNVGGTAQGLFTLTGAMANFAPSIVGYVYGQAVSASATSVGGEDAAASSSELSGLLSLVVCGCYLSSAVCFYVASLSSPATAATKSAKS